MERTERTAVFSGVACALFAAFLLFMAVFHHSAAFFAGGMLTVSRAVTGFLVAAGIRLSKKRTENFSSGLYKLENLVVTVIGILIVFGGYELVKLVIFRIKTGEALVDGPGKAIPTFLAAAILGFALGAFKNRVGKKENCPSLQADGGHSYIDAVAMILIAAGVGLAAAGLSVADSVAALLVALTVFVSGGRIAMDGVKVLLDASVERSLLDQVESIARSDPRIEDVLEVSGRNSGSYRFFTLRLVPARHDLDALSAITRDLKERIHREIKNADEVSIEYGTERVGRKSVAVPLDGEGRYAGTFTGASRFAVFDVDETEMEIILRRIMGNPHGGTGPEDGIRLAVMLARQGIDAMVAAGPPEDRDTRYTIDAYGIGLLPLPRGTGDGGAEAALRDALKQTRAVEGRAS